MFSVLITVNKEAYKVKFGMMSLITLDQISYIKDKKELLKLQFCLSNVAKLDNTSLTFEQKEEFFENYASDNFGLESMEEVLSEATALALGEYTEINKTVYDELFTKAVGEIGLSIEEFNAAAPQEINLAYQGYMTKKELEANCVLVALRKSKDSKANLISLLGGDGYKYISETEREEVLKTLNIE